MPDPPVSLPEKLKLAEELLVGSFGPESIDAFGADVSILQPKLAGVWSTFPASSTARTSKVWEPSVSEEYACGAEHAVKAPPSRRHSKLATPEPPASLPENVKLAAAESLCAGGVISIWACGGVESSTYVSGEEQAEGLPIDEVVVALKRVTESSRTETLTPAASSAPVAVVVGAPEQSLVV
jgi:hypothetical protein